MPQGGPLTPLASLLETLKREARNPTEQEKAFIATELAKANAPMAGMTAPPAGAPAPQVAVDPYAPDAAKLWAQAQSVSRNMHQPSVLDSPAASALNKYVLPAANKVFDFLNPVTGAWQIEQGLNRAKYNPMTEITGGAVPQLSMTKDFYKAGADVAGGIMQAAGPTAAVTSPRALAYGLPVVAMADRVLEAAAQDPNIDPDKLLFGANVAGLGMMGLGFKGDIARAGMPTPEYKPWHNLDPHAVIEAQRTGGGSFDPITGKQVELQTGDAAAALGRRSTQLVTPEPVRADDLLNFLDKQQGPLSKPGRVLGVYPGDKGHYAEVSQTYRGEGAPEAAMRDAFNAPLQQESIFVQGPNGPEFPTVANRFRPVEAARQALTDFHADERGVLDLSRMVDKDFTVDQSVKGEFSAVNPDTGNTVSIKQGSGKAGSGQPNRADIIPVDIHPEWTNKLKSVGIEEFKQMPTQSFEQTFQVGPDGMLEVQTPIKERLKTLYNYGKDVVKANWDQNKPIFDLASDITSHDPASVASRSFAALSPQVSVAQNLHDMLKVFNRIKMSGKDASKFTPEEMTKISKDIGNPSSKVPNLLRAFNDQPLSSYGKEPFSPIGKVEHLAEGMKTGERGIPFDLWMQRVLGLSADTPPGNAMSYEAMYRAVAGVAKELKTTPFEMMHQIWSAARTIHGSETIGPTQMLEVASVNKLPGTTGFERQLDRGLILDIPKLQAQQRGGMLWDIKGNLLANGDNIKSLALPVGVATAYMMLPEEQKKKMATSGLLLGAIAPTRMKKILSHGSFTPENQRLLADYMQQPHVVEVPFTGPESQSGKFMSPAGTLFGDKRGASVEHFENAGGHDQMVDLMKMGVPRINMHAESGIHGVTFGAQTAGPLAGEAAQGIVDLHQTRAGRLGRKTEQYGFDLEVNNPADMFRSSFNKPVVNPQSAEEIRRMVEGALTGKASRPATSSDVIKAMVDKMMRDARRHE